MAGNAASAPQPARPAEPGALRRRILSALILAPAALVAIIAGPSWTALMVAVAAGIMAWEWGGLIGRLNSARDLVQFVGTAVIAVLLAGFVSVPAGLLAGAVGIAVATTFGDPRRAAWTGGGLGWIVLSSICFVWLRAAPGEGLPATLWVLALVWAIDIAAYAAGRNLGGPKLAPRISPNKTWSGLCGGIAAALLVGAAAGWFMEVSSPWVITLASGGLAVVEQIGEIAESYAKRRFGAKDSSTLIPGHGGLLDRLDGMLAVVTVVALLHMVAGESILSWR